MKQLDKKYDYRAAEARWKQYWEDLQIFQWDETLSREMNFVINTPPPTISGSLHMGHISSYTKQDFIGRFQRMWGKNVFYPIGFDDNGLPTERYVEKVKGIRGTSMPRGEFIKICQEVTEDTKVQYKQILQDMGFSIDWHQEYHTISPTSKKLSQMSFLDLYRQGALYHKEEPMFWDVVDQTALAQAEIEDHEMASYMNDILFGVDISGAECQMCPAAGGCGKLLIGTTRPELLPACVAVFVHPDDIRYQELIGKYAITPLFGSRVPIIADVDVAMDKGTGVVMCCTFGDQQDIVWWKRHQLPLVDIVGKDGRLSNLTSKVLQNPNLEILEPALAQSALESLEGLKLTEAREKILSLLDDNLCLLQQTAIKHQVKCAERSGKPVEILVTQQWFVKVLDKKEELLAKARECVWHPTHMRNRIENWIEGLSWDWCISRQRFSGVEIPVWYSKRPGEEGKVLLPELEQLPVDPLVDLPKGYSRDEVEGDRDVMDTWATSSLTPQLSSGALNEEFALDWQRHQKLYPADLQTHAHEIIRSWDFYSLVKSMYHADSVPWKHVMLCGWILAADHSKMSKSKGNVITPEQLLSTKGADITRYWASTSRLGIDTAYSDEITKVGNKLVNKLWNVANFLQMHCMELTQEQGLTLEQLETLDWCKAGSIKASLQEGFIGAGTDQWLLGKLQETVKLATETFLDYDYTKAREVTEEFFWNTLCDNYLEIVKIRCYGPNGKKYMDQVLDEAIRKQLQQQRISAVATIYYALQVVLKLLAPFMPFVTEEIFAQLYPTLQQQSNSIHAKGTWPKPEDLPKMPTVVGDQLVEILSQIRRYKSEHNLAMNSELSGVKISGMVTVLPEDMQQDLLNVSGIQTLEYGECSGATGIVVEVMD